MGKTPKLVKAVCDEKQLVLYEISDLQKHAKVVRTLKKRHRISIKLTESSYALHMQSLPVRIFDEVKQPLSSDDQLYVIPPASPYTVFGARKTTEWLSDYLPAQRE